MLNRAIIDSTPTAQTEALELESDMKFIKKLNGSEAAAVLAPQVAANMNPHLGQNSRLEKPAANTQSADGTVQASAERRAGGGCIPVSGFDR